MNAPFAARLAWLAGAALFVSAGELLALLPSLPLQLGPPERFAWTVIATLLVLSLERLRSRRLARETSQLAIIEGLGRTVNRSRNLEAAARTLARHLARRVRADAACVRLLNQDGRLALAGGLQLDVRYARTRRWVSVEAPTVRRALARAAPQYFRHLPRGSELAEMPAAGQATAALVVPLLERGRVMGVLNLAFLRPSRVSSSELALLRRLGERAGEWLTTIAVLDDLVREARTDPLTGLASRRHFEEMFRRECARSRRLERPLAVAVIDLDEFKAINDAYGHAAADQALVAVAEVLRRARAYDVVARLGGDEFIMLMPETTEIEAVAVAERIRAGVAELNARQELPFPIALSIGVAAGTGPGLELLMQADAAMYADKERRRRAQQAARFAPAPRASLPVHRRQAS